MKSNITRKRKSG